MKISMTKGYYGQWIVTVEIRGYFVSKQYYGYSKKEAKSLSIQEIARGSFCK